MSTKHHYRAETLLEIIMAVFIIGLGAAASLAIISTAVSANESLKKRSIAVNLAREGLEVFINARNVNLQSAQYVQDGDCWRALDLSDCAGVNLWGEGGDYIVSLDSADMTWSVIDMAQAISNPPSESFAVKLDSYGFYTQAIAGNKTDFYRAIQISPVSDQFDTIDYEEGDVLKITSIVYFRTRTGFSKAHVSTVLTHH